MVGLRTLSLHAGVPQQHSSHHSSGLEHFGFRFRCKNAVATCVALGWDMQMGVEPVEHIGFAERQPECWDQSNSSQQDLLTLLVSWGLTWWRHSRGYKTECLSPSWSSQLKWWLLTGDVFASQLQRDKILSNLIVIGHNKLHHSACRMQDIKHLGNFFSPFF